MKKIFALFAWLLLGGSLWAQSTPDSTFVQGVVANEKEEVLIGASVYWKDTRIGTVSDADGRFRLPGRDKAALLVVQYVGYTPIEVEVLPEEKKLWIELSGAAVLKEAVVSGHGFGNAVSTLTPHNIESINSKELRKAPCCNLSESFTTNGAIDVAYPNALTGVREIQMLGLRGIYSQFTLESRPTMSGIATPLAFEFYPGTWLEGIQLAKGASSVRNGFNGMTGQINAELVKPHRDKPFFLNLFTSSEGRGEMNLHLNKKGEKLSHGLLLHGNLTENRWDMNSDNFYDGQQKRQANALYRMFYETEKMCAQFNLQAISDFRQGGQIAALPGSSELFRTEQRNERIEAWGKLGIEGIKGKPYNQMGNILSASWHRSNAQFGRNTYAATQTSLYWQTLLQSIIGTTDHQVVLAPSIQYDDIQEQVNESDLSRREFVPGTMLEYTYSRPNLRMEMPDLVLVLGARADWNSRLGWFLTPRMSAKYNFSKSALVRVSAGRGYRSPNLVAENLSLLASNRNLSFAQDLGAEEAWNYGVNYTHNFKVFKRNASISMDAYRTDFVRQIIVDVEEDYSQVLFYNLNGKSYSNSLLLMLQYNLFKGLDLKVAYKRNEVRSTYIDGEQRLVPLVAAHRGLFTADYISPGKKWEINSSVQVVGPQRLPDNSQLPHEYTHDFPAKSPTYALWNAQVTRNFKKFELYLGGENINGFNQHHAIIAANEPWSPYFNGSQIWAPMMRQVVYLGFRYPAAAK